MPRFFIQKKPAVGDSIVIEGEDAHHIARSLRMAVGEEITLCDPEGCEYASVIRDFLDDKQVTVEILSVAERTNESPLQIVLYQALPKGDKMDSVIQKAVECGVHAIVPFESSRCVVRMKADAEARKTERRTRIAAEAAKQSGRSVLPVVYPTVSFNEMLERAKGGDLCLFCYEGEGTAPLGAVLPKLYPILKKGERPLVNVIVGSEGGFSQEEVRAAEARGMVAVGLGKRILRTETASSFVLACLCYATELQP